MLADDDQSVRAAVADELDSDGRFTVVAEAATADDAVIHAEAQRPDVVLLDVRMPGGGVDAARRIFDLSGPTTVAVLSGSLDGPTVGALLRHGVRGMFLKGHAGPSLAEDLFRCHAGEVILSTPAAAAAVRALIAAD
ncbi:MAG TPA: response regulator transcription factor [Jatrophihabitans sp.]|uniref:response regulator n=1 Tax=Jatrophihabitans sp. TaxID=1932789 RepID=UPI002E0557AD|nr:response regulator transcription factor [Jatrophihabitans sp.]